MTRGGRCGRLAALILLTACSVGTTARHYPPAQGPAGATVSLALSGNRAVAGELLSVEAGSLLLLEGQEIVRVELPLVRSGRAPKVRFEGPTLQPDTRERLRLLSRYPQGVSPELEGRLLQAYGRTTVREIS